MRKKNREPNLEADILKAILENEALTTVDLPKELFVFPLTKRPYFPLSGGHLILEPGFFLELIKECQQTEHQAVALVMTKKESIDPLKAQFQDLYSVGVMAKILRTVPLETGGAQVYFNIERRVTLVAPIKMKKGIKAEIEYTPETIQNTSELKAYSHSILSTIKDLTKLSPLHKDELQFVLHHVQDSEPGRLADIGSSLTGASREELQDILETFDIPQRVAKALLLLRKEHGIAEIQNKISKQVESSISKNQREFFLKEQLKTIKRELGIEKDDKQIERLKFEERIKKKSVPADVLKTIHEELEKLSALEPHSSEYGVCRGYLDWLTSIPWGTLSKENHDLAKAEKILQQDHYGLEDIKERILEFISVGKLTQGIKGSILCLVGPPGVGKTSIGRSIARALGRKFFRFSVGGMRDEAEIKGHRRTYIGAMPGKILQALKFCQTMNPVILLDEVDKIGSSHHGDPASALLEVLDPEQNREFLDHYLDVRCDLSNILFITTANVLDTIPDALKDRMEILRLSGYIQEEKIAIAERYLIPKHRKEMGLKATQISISEQGLKEIINGYARESGVRNLENQIKKIFRKAAHQLVKHPEIKKIAVTERNLKEFIGKAAFSSDRFYAKTPTGVATGLAWTAMGGATLYIETARLPAEKTEMKLTGQAGSVMKESSEIAWSYLQSALERYAPRKDFFKKNQVHIHIPEGATPKDGPSAGITMVTALLSLLLNRPITEDLGMTGEITLTGRVLQIGGVKEKVVAARRSELKTLILPEDNLKDVEELPGYLKEGLAIHFVTHYDQVVPIAFKEAPCKP